MNFISSILRNITNIFPNVHNHIYSVDDEDPLTTVLDNTEHRELSRERNGRRCGYCQQHGHNVLYCNHEDVTSGKNELNDIITNNVYHPHALIENTLQEWFENKSDNLLKAICCYKRILRYRYSYTRSIIEEKIKNYVFNEMYIIRLRNYQTIPQTITPARMTIIIPYRFIRTLRDLYNSLSIQINTAKPKLICHQKECPICFNELNQNTIQKTDCNHEFCKECLTKTIQGFLYRRNKANCPLCRSNMNIIYQNKKFKNETISTRGLSSTTASNLSNMDTID